MSLQHCRHVRYQKSHPIAPVHPSLFQGARQLIHPRVELAISVTCVPVYHGGFIRIDKGAAVEEIKRIQGLVPDMVPHGHCLLRLRASRLPTIASPRCSSILLDHAPESKTNLSVVS